MALERQRIRVSRAITVKHIHLHLFSIVSRCIFIHTNRRLDRTKTYEAHLSATGVHSTCGGWDKNFNDTKHNSTVFLKLSRKLMSLTLEEHVLLV